MHSRLENKLAANPARLSKHRGALPGRIFRVLARFLWCFLLLSVLSGTGCRENYPLGLTREQWEVLSPAMQKEFEARQELLDTNNAVAKPAETPPPVKATPQPAPVPQRARASEILSVFIHGGLMDIEGGMASYEPISLEITRGERKPVLFRKRGHPASFRVIYVSLNRECTRFTFDDGSPRRYIFVNTGWQHEQVVTGGPIQNPNGTRYNALTFRLRLSHYSF